MGEVFWTALRLGLTSFGGPIAHLGYFERAYVRRLGWLTSSEYAGLVALCQTLPGPTSSQVGFLVGWRVRGYRGALAAWAGFTLPSALLMYAFAVLTARTGSPVIQSLLHGLMLTAVAVVAQAVWSMARSLCPDWQRVTIAALSGLALLVLSKASMQLVVMSAGAVGGWVLCKRAARVQLGGLGCGSSEGTGDGGTAGLPPHAATLALTLYGALLAALATLPLLDPHGPMGLAGVFYRAGALVFGGGHVVLPLLRQELVPQGWVSDEQFLAGYGLAQGVPGPLFTVAAYLGAVNAPEHLSGLWATVAIVAIFLPGLLLATGAFALVGLLRRFPTASAALAGINASVVGVLGAALYDPVWRGGVRDGIDATIAVVGFLLLQHWRFPAPAIAALCVMSSVIRQPYFL
jgi:chromate transporter